MAKLRSYNQQFLIAAALIANIFNDIIIQRRKHRQDRDYSKPINIKDILQKNIQVPCIFGDRSIILKSLQNHQGGIKLPLMVLQSGGIKTDQIRIADLHVDLIYQRDQQFTRLAKDHPLYSPYDLRRRRPLPITIQYELSLIAKYKEDLDQMLTNWMVHCRPDLYVKWWHPRDKSMPLESQILWSQSINYKKPDQQPTSKFQYQATTSFTFKTWIFPGLDYKEDEYNTDQDGIIKYFNWFPTTVNYTGNQGQDGYPSLGQIGSTPAGFFAVPNTMQFENDGSDQDGIKKGKYYINNLTQSPSSLYNGDNGIKDIEATADILTKDTFENMPKWQQYQGMCQFDNISNQRAGFKAVYFHGGFPLSAMLDAYPISGDLLFQHFCSEGNSKIDKISGFYGPIQQEQFGMCFTESLKPIISYDFENKIFNVSAHIKSERYEMLLNAQMSSLSGITQIVQLKSINTLNNDIKLKLKRSINEKFQPLTEFFENNTVHIKILNNSGFKNNYQPIMFACETSQHKKYLNKIKKLINTYWDQLEIYPVDMNGDRLIDIDIQKKQYKHYKLDCQNKTFISNVKKIANREDLSMFVIRQEFTINDIQYTLIANNHLYFVLSDQGIYDWGVISLPRFKTGNYPVFRVTYPNGQLTYGIGVDCNIACAIR